MDITLEQRIASAIKKDLPNQIGEILTEELKTGKQAKLDLEEAKDEYKKLFDEYTIIKKNLESIKSEVEQAKSVLQREETLKRNEAAYLIKCEVDKIKVSESQSKVDMMNNFVGLLVKNPQAVTSLFTSHSGQMDFGPNSQAYSPISSHTIVENNLEK